MKELKEFIKTRKFLLKCRILELNYKKRTKINNKKLFKKKYKKCEK